MPTVCGRLQGSIGNGCLIFLSEELGLPVEGAPRERLRLLDRELRRRTQAAVNWMGTYTQVVQKALV